MTIEENRKKLTKVLNKYEVLMEMYQGFIESDKAKDFDKVDAFFEVVTKSMDDIIDTMVSVAVDLSVCIDHYEINKETINELKKVNECIKEYSSMKEEALNSINSYREENLFMMSLVLSSAETQVAKIRESIEKMFEMAKEEESEAE